MTPQSWMTVGRVALGVYAVLLGVGGLIGFLKAGSRPSLIAGLASAAIAGLALFLTYDFTIGEIVGIVLSIAMLAVFSIRFRKTGKFMPSGLLAGTSLIMIGLLVAVMLGRSGRI